MATKTKKQHRVIVQKPLGRLSEAFKGLDMSGVLPKPRSFTRAQLTKAVAPVKQEATCLINLEKPALRG
mgnify:CR=1 FL=1